MGMIQIESPPTMSFKVALENPYFRNLQLLFERHDTFGHRSKFVAFLESFICKKIKYSLQRCLTLINGKSGNLQRTHG